MNSKYIIIILACCTAAVLVAVEKWQLAPRLDEQTFSDAQSKASLPDGVQGESEPDIEKYPEPAKKLHALTQENDQLDTDDQALEVRIQTMDAKLADIDRRLNDVDQMHNSDSTRVDVGTEERSSEAEAAEIRLRSIKQHIELKDTQ